MRHGGVKCNPKRQTAKLHANTHGLTSRHTCRKASTRLFLKALLSYQTSSTDTVLVLRNDQPMKCLNLGRSFLKVDQTSAVMFVAVFSKTSRFVG